MEDMITFTGICGRDDYLSVQVFYGRYDSLYRYSVVDVITFTGILDTGTGDRYDLPIQVY